MEKEDIEFIKNLVLRFIDVYPVNKGRWSIDNLSTYLTNMCPALCYVGFYADLNEVFQSLLLERLLFQINARDVTNQRDIVMWELTESGKTKAASILDFNIINIVLDIWIKDKRYRDWVIQRFLPFQRFSKYELSERVREVMYWDNLNNDTIAAARHAIICDHYSFDRLFDFLKKDGFIREYEKDKYKFTKRGRALIDIGNYEEYVESERYENNKNRERERMNDLLAENNLTNVQIQRSLLQTNKWIALAGIVAALYYLLEIQLEVKKQHPYFYARIIPFLLTFELALVSLGLVLLLWQTLKNKPEDNKKE